MLLILTVACALGCGIIGGVFFAFSTFVMKALARLPASQGIAAMQSINIVVLNPWFLGAFFGTGALSIVAIIAAAAQWRIPHAIYLLAGGAFYLVGTLLVTIFFNVPRNQSLASLLPEAAGSESEWRTYLSEWTWWNHVRTAAALLAAVFFSLALAT